MQSQNITDRRVKLKKNRGYNLTSATPPICNRLLPLQSTLHNRKHTNIRTGRICPRLVLASRSPFRRMRWAAPHARTVTSAADRAPAVHLDMS